MEIVGAVGKTVIKQVGDKRASLSFGKGLPETGKTPPIPIVELGGLYLETVVIVANVG